MTCKHKVNDVSQALVYITDCNLATVCDMAGKKSKSKSEYSRQKSIAQTAVSWMVQMGVDFSGTRAEEVVKAGSVAEWAAQWEQS
jgi:hypothetical protein